MSASKQTHNHKIIRSWVEERKGIPSKIKGTGVNKEEGVLRIHFPEFSDSNNFEELDWDTFFRDFDGNNLDFLYQDKKENGETSTFHKFVERD